MLYYCKTKLYEFKTMNLFHSGCLYFEACEGCIQSLYSKPGVCKHKILYCLLLHGSNKNIVLYIFNNNISQSVILKTADEYCTIFLFSLQCIYNATTHNKQCIGVLVTWHLPESSLTTLKNRLLLLQDSWIQIVWHTACTSIKAPYNIAKRLLVQCH